MKNYHGFGAPVELFIFIDAALEKGSWLDTGMFIQNIMLAAREHGLDCPDREAVRKFQKRSEGKLQSLRASSE